MIGNNKQPVSRGFCERLGLQPDSVATEFGLHVIHTPHSTGHEKLIIPCCPCAIRTVNRPARGLPRIVPTKRCYIGICWSALSKSLKVVKRAPKPLHCSYLHESYYMHITKLIGDVLGERSRDSHQHMQVRQCSITTLYV